MLRVIPFLVAASLLGVLLAAPATGAGEVERFIVGHDPERSQEARAAITLAGGTPGRTSPELGFTIAYAQDGQHFREMLRLAPNVQWTERDDAARLDGAQWNGAQWNGAQWNGAQWNGAQWNGAQWNAATWTWKHFRMNGGSWSYDMDTSDPGLVWQWGSLATKAPDAWSATTGTRSATLCVLDSGVAWDHPDLNANMWTGPAGEHGWNAQDPLASAYDDAGHGTHIAGIAAAHVGNAFGMAGVANVQIMAVKVLDATGAGYESDLAFGLVWCANRGADVAVMALSVTEAEHLALDRALQYAADRDVLLLASAGNGGGAVSFPARDPRVVAVSAVDGDLALAPFSNRGREIEVAAPGVAMLGTFPGDGYVFGSGTSQAVAFAAGVAALIRDANGSLTAPEARAILAASAQDLGPAGTDERYGAGMVRVDAALARATAT